jgi:hypothetical protein
MVNPQIRSRVLDMVFVVVVVESVHQIAFHLLCYYHVVDPSTHHRNDSIQARTGN